MLSVLPLVAWEVQERRMVALRGLGAVLALVVPNVVALIVVGEGGALVLIQMVAGTTFVVTAAAVVGLEVEAALVLCSTAARNTFVEVTVEVVVEVGGEVVEAVVGVAVGAAAL